MSRMQIDTPRNRNLALHHANLLQDRKHVDSEILASIEALIDYPTSSNVSASTPSASDLASFRSMIKPFQISDYDSLLEERNLADKCAYVFCPLSYDKKRRGVVQLVGTGRYGKVVPSSKVRQWCSPECAKRAMFIKVQLSELPACERAGGLGNKVDVLEEGDDEALARKMISLEVSGASEDDLRKAMAELALERGEKDRSARQAALLKGDLVEKAISRPAEPPAHSGNSNTFAIDGYTPRTAGDRDGGEDVEEHTDWDLG